MKEIDLILAGWLIDGTGARTLKDVALETSDGYILRIRKMLPATCSWMCRFIVLLASLYVAWH